MLVLNLLLGPPHQPRLQLDVLRLVDGGGARRLGTGHDLGLNAAVRGKLDALQRAAGTRGA